MVSYTAEQVAAFVKDMAAWRGIGRFREVIVSVDSFLNHPMADDASKVALILEGFKAARESDDNESAVKFAVLIAAEDPEVPSVKAFLRDMRP